MTVVANFFSGVIKSIPMLIAKVGTILLLIFTIGMFAGYSIALISITPLVFLIPVLAMVIMWYELDEGVLVLFILTILVLFFPETISAFISWLL